MDIILRPFLRDSSGITLLESYYQHYLVIVMSNTLCQVKGLEGSAK